MEAHLNNHHRDTVAKIFSHPASGNVEWRQVRSLLEAIGTVTAKHDGKLEVAVGPEREVFNAPKGKEVRRADARRPTPDTSPRRLCP